MAVMKDARHCENFWAFTGPKIDFGLILLISNMMIHRSFTCPTHLLSANIQGPVPFAVSDILCKTGNATLTDSQVTQVAHIFDDQSRQVGNLCSPMAKICWNQRLSRSKPVLCRMVHHVNDKTANMTFKDRSRQQFLRPNGLRCKIRTIMLNS